MEPFVLQLFGLFQAKVGGRTLHFYSDKAKALLAYLVVEGNEVRRQPLADFFWPGYHPTSAQMNLRNTLSRLRKVLAPIDLLQTTRQSIRIDLTHPALWCDLGDLGPPGAAPLFRRSRSGGQRPLSSLASGPPTALSATDCPDTTAA